MFLARHNDPFERLFTVFDTAEKDNSYRVFEEKDAWQYEVDMPGVDKSSLEVQLLGRELNVSGKRKCREGERTYSFKFQIPNQGKRESIEAVLEQGVLQLKVPKAEPTSLTIQVK